MLGGYGFGNGVVQVNFYESEVVKGLQEREREKVYREEGGQNRAYPCQVWALA